jgi:hypothetical protein
MWVAHEFVSPTIKIQKKLKSKPAAELSQKIQHAEKESSRHMEKITNYTDKARKRSFYKTEQDWEASLNNDFNEWYSTKMRSNKAQIDAHTYIGQQLQLNVSDGNISKEEARQPKSDNRQRLGEQGIRFYGPITIL